MHRHEFELPAEDIAAFQRDGALCVRQLFTAPEVERAASRRTDGPVRAQGGRGGDFQELDDAGLGG